MMSDLKVPVHFVPPASILYEALAMAEGARIYGSYNWRTTKAEVMTHIGACLRHLYAYLDGEDIDPTSGVHHLGHAKSRLGILIDCIEIDYLIDNRPPPGNAGKLVRQLSESGSTLTTLMRT
jgi:hypothetical protein